MRWFKDRQTLKRAAIPNVRSEWSSGDAGHFVTVKVANRMTEDLRIYKVEARTRLVDEERTYDDGGSIIGSVRAPTSRCEKIDWRVEAGQTGFMNFRLDGADSRQWLRFTAATSAGTFRRLRFTAQP